MYLNQNGLVNGKIPASKSCKFLTDCKLKHDGCPTKNKLLSKDYDCNNARIHSILVNMKSPLLIDLVKKIKR